MVAVPVDGDLGRWVGLRLIVCFDPLLHELPRLLGGCAQIRRGVRIRQGCVFIS